ncbi:hypothetical protein [Pirellula sp. SH-Sr6A]|uniref:hypothetical protein n=1 Tax=Pirellula sp. SH-Sr6A TaxID=1632865 RepID=UPI00143BA76D|nr:hypothetical protein [Pirellula sp. SH-Sr6A]
MQNNIVAMIIDRLYRAGIELSFIFRVSETERIYESSVDAVLTDSVELVTE